MARGFDDEEARGIRDSFLAGGGILSNTGDYDPRTPDDYDYQVQNYDTTQFESEDDFVAYLEGSSSTGPAMLTDRPTSSTNAGRPRTVAAGYQPYVGTKRGGTPREEQLGKMTVMFRDGSLYNYYDVTPGEWQNFKSSISKGAPWLNKGFPNGKQKVDGLFIGKPQGPADLSMVPASVQRNIQRTARSAQVQFATGRAVTIDVQGTPRTFKSTGGYVSKAGARRGRIASRGLGKNPSNGGKNPY